MKDFLTKTIKSLWATTGVDQEKDLLSKSIGPKGKIITDSKGFPIAASELLHVLVKECDKFKMSDEKKQELINQQILDEEKASHEPFGEKFKGLTAGLIYRALYPYSLKHKTFNNTQKGRWDDELAARAKQNEIEAKKRLEEKKKADPNYNVYQDAKDRTRKIATRSRVITENRTPNSKKRFYDANGVEEVDYEEVETKK